jgi:hypothetical protein
MVNGEKRGSENKNSIDSIVHSFYKPYKVIFYISDTSLQGEHNYLGYSSLL